MKPSSLRIGMTALLLAAAFLGFYLVIVELGLPVVSLAVMFGFPMLAGAIIMRFRPKGSFTSFGMAVVWLLGIAGLSILGSYFTGIEGLICIAMAIVPILFGTLIGGLIYLVVLRRRARDQTSIHVVSAPILAVLLLGLLPQGPRQYDITHSIEIDAPPTVVFAMLKAIPDIAPEEIQTRFSHLLGVPKPTSAVWETTPAGTIRHSHWGPNVHFRESITEVQENKLIAWQFEFPEGWIAEGIQDPHIEVGGPYFDVLSGSYRLDDLGGRTRLSLTTRTYDNSELGFYAEFWHRFFFEDFHEVILELVKNRTEARAL